MASTIRVIDAHGSSLASMLLQMYILYVACTHNIQMILSVYTVYVNNILCLNNNSRNLSRQAIQALLRTTAVNTNQFARVAVTMVVCYHCASNDHISTEEH